MKNIITKKFGPMFVKYEKYTAKVEGEVDENGEAFTFSVLKIYNESNDELSKEDMVTFLKSHPLIQKIEDEVLKSLGITNATIK